MPRIPPPTSLDTSDFKCVIYTNATNLFSVSV